MKTYIEGNRKEKFNEDRQLAAEHPSYKGRYYWCKHKVYGDMREALGIEPEAYEWHVYDIDMEGYKTALERFPSFSDEDFIVTRQLRNA